MDAFSVALSFLSYRKAPRPSPLDSRTRSILHGEVIVKSLPTYKSNAHQIRCAQLFQLLERCGKVGEELFLVLGWLVEEGERGGV